MWKLEQRTVDLGGLCDDESVGKVAGATSRSESSEDSCHPSSPRREGGASRREEEGRPQTPHARG